MQELKTHRNVAVFDVDGVVVQNPDCALSGPPILDNNFWANHWSRPDEAQLNDEVCELARSLMRTNWQVVFLTARPGIYRKQTEELLRRAGLLPRPEDVKMVLNPSYNNTPMLFMIEGNDIPNGSAGWKQTMLKKWVDSGVKVRFFMEDYRPNAEAARAVVPVFLYERKKPSQHLPVHPCCGGLAACWCRDVALARANS
jgi:hypothetical protein